MPIPDRKHMEALYQIFNRFALDDQRRYYRNTRDRYRLAANQVNQIRAFFALLTGISAALSGLIVQSGQRMDGLNLVTVVLGASLLISIIGPALGGAFGTLADLYQWDRLLNIYDSGLENIEVADSRSPDSEMPDDVYWASLRAFTEGTLNIMRDETAQWGQLIRTPEQITQFIEAEQAKVNAASPLDSSSNSISGNVPTSSSASPAPIVPNTASEPSEPSAPSDPPIVAQG
jgi:hypothetical protein